MATRYNNLGLAYRDLGDANKAISYYEQSLAIDLNVFGDQHPNVAIRYNNLGEAYRALGDAKKAIEYYEEGLSPDGGFYFYSESAHEIMAKVIDRVSRHIRVLRARLED